MQADPVLETKEFLESGDSKNSQNSIAGLGVEAAGELGAGMMDPESLAARLKKLGVDGKAEEKRLQERIAELSSWAKGFREPKATAQLASTVLLLSVTAWQSLVSDCIAGEISFRADLNRAVRRAVGLLASLQEEMALYNVRQDSEYLWKKHLHSLLYLADSASRLLQELERISTQAGERGLSKKAADVKETRNRLRQHLEEIAKLNHSQLHGKAEGLRVDPEWIETRWQELLNQLVCSAKSAEESAAKISLGNTALTASSTEWQALVSDCPPGEQSFRAHLNRVLRQAVGLRAAIQEETALYRACRSTRYQWRGHLSSLFYLASKVEKILPELEALRNEAQQRNLTTKAEHLMETIARIRQHLEEISKLRTELAG